jgi:hypothetical protein
MQLSIGFLNSREYTSSGVLGLEFLIILEMSEFSFLKPVKKKSDTIATEKNVTIKRIFLLENLLGFKAM